MQTTLNSFLKKKKSTTALEKILGLTDYNGFYRIKEFTVK